MHLVRALVLMPALLLVAAGVSSPALASCVQTTVAERATLAEVVVYGAVIETRQTFAPAGGVIRFRPERFLKGTLPGEVEVYLGPTHGGAPTAEETSFFGTGSAAAPSAPKDNTPLALVAVAIAAIALAGALFARRYAGPSTFTTTAP